MGYSGFKTSLKRCFYSISSVQSSVFSLMFSLMRHRVNKYNLKNHHSMATSFIKPEYQEAMPSYVQCIQSSENHPVAS